METILCPTDFSPESENAVRYADKLAQHLHSHLVLFHTIYEPVGSVINSYSGLPYYESTREVEFRQDRQERLDTLRKSLENNNWRMLSQYETKIRYGLTQNTVPLVAQEVQADLIVVPNEGKKTLTNPSWTSVSANVIQVVHCPVLLIPPKFTFKPLRKIVFATDLQGEPFTEVSFVIRLAALFQAEILFLHLLADDEVTTKELAYAEFIRLNKRLSYQKATFYTEINPNMSAGITQFCQHHKADLLVMGYRHRNFWQNLFEQGNSLEMVYHTSIPFLVIHYRC